MSFWTCKNKKLSKVNQNHREGSDQVRTDFLRVLVHAIIFKGLFCLTSGIKVNF